LCKTGYEHYVPAALWQSFYKHYPAALKQEVQLTDYCRFAVAPCKAMGFTTAQQFDVLYFDAFAAVHQPEMWTGETLAHVCSFLRPGGVFVTYAITGNLKRSMKSLGFSIEKVPGAPGKREMLRAVKLL